MNLKFAKLCFLFSLALTFLSPTSSASTFNLKFLKHVISVACFDSTIKSAIQKITKDSKTINSDLDLIGLQAEKCVFNSKSDSIECLNAQEQIVFTVELESLSPLPSTKNTKSYLFSFRTGNENINVIYDIEVTKYVNTQKCEVTKVDSHTELPR